MRKILRSLVRWSAGTRNDGNKRTGHTAQRSTSECSSSRMNADADVDGGNNSSSFPRKNYTDTWIIALEGSTRRDGGNHHQKKRNRSFQRYIIWIAMAMAWLHSLRNIQNYRLSDLTLYSGNIYQEEEEESFPPEGWSDVKLLLYITTHLSHGHKKFLPCWKDVMKRLHIFKDADLMIYTSTKLSKRQLRNFPFQNTTIKLFANPGYQEGAVQAMVDPYLENNNTSWFDDYDWVIRLNPDVLIRKDEWLMQTMLNTSVDMIVHECRTTNRYSTTPILHTDFFAFRPRAVDRERLLQANRKHAEGHFTAAFRHLYDAGRFAYVEGAKNAREGICRIEGVHSPVLHVHELSKYCPYYFDATKEGFYR